MRKEALRIILISASSVALWLLAPPRCGAG